MKAGKFEPDLPFTQARTYNLFPYEPYLVGSGASGLTLGAPERGLEVSGRPGAGFRYSIAVVERVNSTPGHENDFDADVYLRLSGTSLGSHRFGTFYYRGHNTLVDASGVESRDDFYRVGADFDLRLGSARASFYGLYLRGENSAWRSSGAFVQLDTRVRPWLTLVGRYSVVGAESPQSEMSFDQSLAVGAQGWFFERLEVGFELLLQDRGRPNRGAIAVDFLL